MILGLRPQHLTLAAGDSHTVEVTEALGGVSYIHVTAPSGEKLIIESREDPRVKMGEKVGISFDPAHVMAFDAKTEKRIR